MPISAIPMAIHGPCRKYPLVLRIIFKLAAKYIQATFEGKGEFGDTPNPARRCALDPLSQIACVIVLSMADLFTFNYIPKSEPFATDFPQFPIHHEQLVPARIIAIIKTLPGLKSRGPEIVNVAAAFTPVELMPI